MHLFLGVAGAYDRRRFYLPATPISTLNAGDLFPIPVGDMRGSRSQTGASRHMENGDAPQL